MEQDADEEKIKCGDCEDESGYGRSGEAFKVERETDDRGVKHIVDPRLPTKEEVTAHEMFHSPYRNWCPICVKARGKEMDHRKSLEEPKGLSEYSFDYYFPGDEF